jgi:hypothetical protein
MCQLNDTPYNSGAMYYPNPPARPIPRLDWAIPIDITDLGASLEAYSHLEASIKMLRLCHRFGSGPLSTLPQEVLEQIIGEAHLSRKHQSLPTWKNSYACFQGRCTSAQYYPPNDPNTESEWLECYADVSDWNEEASSNPADYTAEEKSEMMRENLRNDPELQTQLHIDSISTWLRRTCLCKAEKDVPAGGFVRFNDVCMTSQPFPPQY